MTPPGGQARNAVLRALNNGRTMMTSIKQGGISMRKLSFALAAAAALALIAAAPALAQDKIRIGYAVAKSGPNAPGAGITTIPNYKLWVTDVNAAGGINVGGKKMQIEVVEYDDQSS